MKPCPYCAELIQDQAAKCRYCGEWLDPSKRPAWSTGAVTTASALARPSRAAADPMLLDDDDEPEPEHPSASTLPVGSGRPDLDRPTPMQHASWSAPAWLANAQVGRSEPEAPAPTPDRTPLEEVALRMERIRQSAAAVRHSADLDERHPTATLEAEPGVTLPAGSLQAIDVEARSRRATREETRPIPSAPQPAPVVRDDDDDDDDELEDEPPRRKGRRAAPEPEPPAKGKRRKSARAEAEADEAATDDATVRDPKPSRRSKAKPEAAPAPAPRPAWDDDDDLDDEPPPRPAPARGAAPGGFDDDFEDDEDGDDEGGYDDFGEMGPAPRPLPWIPISIGAVVVAVVLGLLFRDTLFGSGGEETDAAAEGDSGEAAEAKDDEAVAEAKAEPEPETKAAGEGQPVEPESKADGGEAAADGGTPPTPPKPAALDPETLAKLDQARTTYMGANGNGKKLEQAGTLLQEILGKSPDHPDALLLMAQVQLEQNKLDESLATATRCTEVAAESADCWLTIGVLQETKGQKDPAKAAYQKYIELAPEGQYAKQVKGSLSRLK